jgi:hypothetical protein
MSFDHFLTDAELSHLDRLNGRLQIVKDRTRGVAEGHYSGFYLWGNGGIGKSFTVLQELNRIGKPFVLRNTRLSAKGLFELIEDHPDSTIVIEDNEQLCKPVPRFN